MTPCIRTKSILSTLKLLWLLKYKFSNYRYNVDVYCNRRTRWTSTKTSSHVTVHCNFYSLVKRSIKYIMTLFWKNSDCTFNTIVKYREHYIIYNYKGCPFTYNVITYYGTPSDAPQGLNLGSFLFLISINDFYFLYLIIIITLLVIGCQAIWRKKCFWTD